MLSEEDEILESIFVFVIDPFTLPEISKVAKSRNNSDLQNRRPTVTNLI